MPDLIIVTCSLICVYIDYSSNLSDVSSPNKNINTGALIGSLVGSMILVILFLMGLIVISILIYQKKRGSHLGFYRNRISHPVQAATTTDTNASEIPLQTMLPSSSREPLSTAADEPSLPFEQSQTLVMDRPPPPSYDASMSCAYALNHAARIDENEKDDDSEDTGFTTRDPPPYYPTWEWTSTQQL